jgi:hypothetical protein
MGILANTVSICHFRVQGELQNLDIYTEAPRLLALQAFRPIDDTSEELSIGWVHLDDPKEHSFSNQPACFHEKYLVVSLRRDQRKVPAALLKEHCEKAYEQFMTDNNVSRVPKQRKEEIKELVRARLMAKTLPDPKVYDLVWDTEANMVTFTTLSPKTIEILEELFKKTFDGLRLVAFHPYERAMTVLDSYHQQLLAQANKAGGDSFLELIKENQWLGFDFLHWLTYQTMNSDSEYRISQPGPGTRGETFVSFINDRVVLVGEGEGGTQMITVNGPQDKFSEIKNAMQGRKRIAEATMHLETDSGKYVLTLKGEMFHFASFSSPAVKIEKDNTVDERMEREAGFFERMALLEKGLQLFNSLFATFLKVRLAPEWYLMEGTIGDWLEAA